MWAINWEVLWIKECKASSPVKVVRHEKLTADRSNADSETKGGHHKSEGRHSWARGGGTNNHWGTDPALLPAPHVWDHQLRGWQGFNLLQTPLPTGWALPKPWPWHTLTGVRARTPAHNDYTCYLSLHLAIHFIKPCTSYSSSQSQ